jgi:hypothetical protein
LGFKNIEITVLHSEEFIFPGWGWNFKPQINLRAAGQFRSAMCLPKDPPLNPFQKLA